MIGAVLRLFGDNAARAAYLVMERKPFILAGEASREAVNGLSAFCPNRVLRELEGDGTISSSLDLLRGLLDSERGDPSASRFFLTVYGISAETVSRLYSIVPLGWVAVLPTLQANAHMLTDLPVFGISSSSFRSFPPVYELDYEFSLITKVKLLLDEGDEATADEFTRLEQKDFYDKASALRTIINEVSQELPENFIESLLSGLVRFNITQLQTSKMLSLLRCERYENMLSTLESKLGPSYRERLITELHERVRKPVPLDPISIISLPGQLVPVAKAMVRLRTASVDEVAKEIRKRKGTTFMLLDELRERGHLASRRIGGKVSFSVRT